MTFTAIAPKTTLDETYRLQLQPLEMPERLLMGAGPSNADPRVIAAMDRQPIGHLDPEYLRLMDEVQKLLRYAWQTHNFMTYPVPGTGSAAMEATLANTVEPGDVVLVAVKGYFGKRMVDMDRVWDIVLSQRLLKDPNAKFLGYGTDDTHDYFRTGPKECNPGRGWVMLELPRPERINRIRWSRDREGRLTDRLPIAYTIEAGPTPDTLVRVAHVAPLRPAVQAAINIDRGRPAKAKRLRFTVEQTNSLEPCIDELEVFDTAGHKVALATAGTRPDRKSTRLNSSHRT